ncbi:MAG: hypothetical protein RL338_599, partial [Chloroflexota bacterium]
MGTDPDATRTCPSCAAATAARFRVCGACGTPLGGERPVAEVRRVVTVVQSDLKGSTALAERLDPETLREILGRYFDEMRAVFEGRGGTIEKIIGDAIVAVYGMPVARPDDPLRALEAAAESQATLAALNEQLEATWGIRLTVRTGVATGEVVFGDVSSSRHVLTGDTMRIGSAMEQACPPFDVLVADSTRELVEGRVAFERLDPVTPKGFTDAFGASRLLGILEPSAPAADDGDASRACSNCGEENPPEHRFCGACAVPLVFVRVRESRKTVTIVFADPKPTTADGRPPSPEATRAVMSVYFDAMKAALERHGGTVEKFIGDAVMAVFGLPVRHEDDALRAARAALEMQDALGPLNERFEREWGLRLMNHIGVNTGEVIAGDATLGQRLVSGDAVNVAARLEQAAGPAEVIVGDLTRRLAGRLIDVEPIAPLALKGKSEPVPAFRLLGARDLAAAERLTSDAPFVGREAELGRLGAALAGSVAARAGRLLVVVGDAGVGKSRLIREFASRAGEQARVLRGRCLAYGDGITFWPLGEIVREAAEIHGDDRPAVALAKLRDLLGALDLAGASRERVAARVASAIGLSTAPLSGTELFWGARTLLEGLARREPLVLIVDDIHAAETTFLEFLDHLCDATSDAPLLLCCSSRHELAERHAEWAEAHADATIALAPLSASDAGAFVDRLLGGSGLDPAVAARIVTAAEGNPLFVEQLVSMLVEEGTLRREGDGWAAADSGAIEVPPSITALLAARLDALPQTERDVIEPASVIGQQFPTDAVAELAPEPIRDAVPGHLESMARKQLLREQPAEDADWRFGHSLIRDTAYGSLLKRDRAAFHERFVGWAERVNAATGRGQEFEEIHGYHLEQAYRYRVELGVVDESVREVGRRASAKLASAGRRAMARGDVGAAASLLRRAVEVRDEADPERLALVPDLAYAQMIVGDHDAARARLDEAETLARSLGDELLGNRATILRSFLGLYSGEEEGWGERARASAEAALPVFERAGDERGQLLCWRLMTNSWMAEARWPETMASAERTVALATRCGDPAARAAAASIWAGGALESAAPVRDVEPRMRELLAENADDQAVAAETEVYLALLLAWRGEVAEAVALAGRARTRLSELRAGLYSSVNGTYVSRIARLAGDLGWAERVLREDREALDAIGATAYRLTAEGFLANLLAGTGRFEEAEELAETVRREAADYDTDQQALWRSALAAVASSRG